MPVISHAQRLIDTVRDTLKQKRISQETLATRLQMSQQAVSRRLTGEVEFSLSQLQIVADVLDVPLEQLVAAPALADTQASSETTPHVSDDPTGAPKPVETTSAGVVPPAAPAGDSSDLGDVA